MQKHFMGTIFTDHAIKRLYERGVAQSDAWYTFRHPDKQAQGTTPGSYRYSKTYGQQRIEVIAKQNEEKQWIILSCWSKLVGDGKPIFSRQENLLWKLVKLTFQKLQKKKK